MEKNKKIIKYLICILIVIVIIMLFILFYLKKANKNNIDDNEIKNNEEYVDGELEGKEFKVETNLILSNKISKSDYYNLKECVDIYQNTISELLKDNSKENQQKLYSMLSTEYIQKEEINNNNVSNKFVSYKEAEMYIDEILMTKLSNTVNAYILKGKLREIANSQVEEYDLIIEMDLKNYTFVVFPYEYIINNQLKEIKENDKIDIATIEEIPNNTYNKFESQTNRYNTIAVPYFEKLKEDLLYDPEYVYDLLDSEYKQKKYNDSLDKFMNYVTQNKESFENMEIDKYARYYYDGYTQYVCIDNFGNYYIFNETSVMNYKILLDTYTIDQPEFIEKYEKATDAEKAGYNINKFMEAINAKDYNYAYNCLANSFKQNNFQTLESFKNYAKSTFFDNNEVQYSKASKEGNYYIYTLTITNADNSFDILQKQFIVNLKENREFEMSFEIE